MDFAELLPVLDVALAPTSLHDIDLVEQALRRNGWTLDSTSLTESGEEHLWRAPRSLSPDVAPPALWAMEVPGRGTSLGLVVATATDGDAEKLRTQLKGRLDVGDLVRTEESDAVWTSWSDGSRDARVAVHRASRLGGKNVSPSVQLSVEPAALPATSAR